MAKLTDTQLVVLSKAGAREDGLAIAPAKLNKAATAKVGASLVARKLMRELKSKPGMPVWREDENGRGVSLMITHAGRDVVGIVEDDDNQMGHTISTKKQKPAAPDGKATGIKKIVRAASSPRDGSKQALVISMLSGKAGATLDALVDTTGWLPHTTRAALTGLRKRGFAIERSRVDGEASIYRITGSAATAA